MIRWFRYARWEDVAKWEAKGWALHTDLGLPHSAYSVLMIWTREGEPS
jgi:hypothetical protein